LKVRGKRQRKKGKRGTVKTERSHKAKKLAGGEKTKKRKKKGREKNYIRRKE